MIDHVLFCTFYHYFLQMVLSLIQWILYQELMEGTVFSSIFEDSILFKHRHPHQIMEFHQVATVWDCKDLSFLR